MLKLDEESDASITTTSMGGEEAQHAKNMGLVKRNDVKPCKKCKNKKCTCKNESFSSWLHKDD